MTPINGQLTFADMELNPSVTTRDELRLCRQAWEIYKLFFEFSEVSTLQLQAVAYQYSARIFEIRRSLKINKTGKTIKLIRRGKGGVNYYSLVNLDVQNE